MSTAAQTRAAGWYWVRPKDGWWRVAEWRKSGYWLSCGSELDWSDGEWAEIDERPIQRQP